MGWFVNVLALLRKVPWQLYLVAGLLLLAYLHGEARHAAGVRETDDKWRNAIAKAAPDTSRLPSAPVTGPTERETLFVHLDSLETLAYESVVDSLLRALSASEFRNRMAQAVQPFDFSTVKTYRRDSSSVVIKLTFHVEPLDHSKNYLQTLPVWDLRPLVFTKYVVAPAEDPPLFRGWFFGSSFFHRWEGSDVQGNLQTGLTFARGSLAVKAIPLRYTFEMNTQTTWYGIEAEVYIMGRGL